jgi:hypothetical protein
VLESDAFGIIEPGGAVVMSFCATRRQDVPDKNIGGTFGVLISAGLSATSAGSAGLDVLGEESVLFILFAFVLECGEEGADFVIFLGGMLVLGGGRIFNGSLELLFFLVTDWLWGSNELVPRFNEDLVINFDLVSCFSFWVDGETMVNSGGFYDNGVVGRYVKRVWGSAWMTGTSLPFVGLAYGRACATHEARGLLCKTESRGWSNFA